MRPLALTLLLVFVAPLAAQNPPRLDRSRVSPLPEAQWTDDIRVVLAKYGQGGAATAEFRTWARHPELLRGVMPFATYVSRESTLPPRDREVLILRTAWLCRSSHVWALHAGIAQQNGLTADEIHRVAEGPEANGWNAFDATLLRMADELHVNAFISDGTWSALSARYDRDHMIDALFAVAEYTLLASAANTYGVQPDAGLTARLPADVSHGTKVPKLPEAQIRLTRARVPALEPSQFTPEIRTMFESTNTGSSPNAFYRTIAPHRKLYPPRHMLSEYIRLKSSLTPRTREMLILRIGWLCRSIYEWSQHEPGGRRAGMSDAEIRGIIEGPSAPVWETFDAAVVRAADELFTDSMISDATWNTLARHYNTQQLMDIVITTVGYRMVSMALNSLGVQLEPTAKGFPPEAVGR
jgi:alkylhydroperoxidase family enzyme